MKLLTGILVADRDLRRSLRIAERGNVHSNKNGHGDVQSQVMQLQIMRVNLSQGLRSCLRLTTSVVLRVFPKIPPMQKLLNLK